MPAVQRGRNMICSIATLPLRQYGPDRAVKPHAMIDQIDPHVPNVVTIAQTIEDLLFDGISWWRITAFGHDLYPVEAQHVDVSSVSLDPPEGTPAPLPSGWDPRDVPVWLDGRPVPASEMIRFDSPNPAVLVVGGRAIKRALLLDKAASMYSDDPRPLDYFTPADGADPVEDDEVTTLLGKWREARKKRATAYVPAALKYNTVDTPSPADLQLVELQRQASLDIANALGIDPEDLGVSTTSRTYANAVDRRRDRINDVLSPFMRAITDRLTMPDVTKRGHVVAFDLDDYMKSNPTERWSTYKTAEEIGVMDADEIRVREGLPGKAPGRAAPPVAAAPAAAPPPPAGEGQPLARDRARAGAEPASMTLSAPTALQFADLPLHTFRVDVEKRMIYGMAVPYGVVGSKYGLRFRFLQNSLKWNERAPGRVKLLRDHNMTQAIGFAKTLAHTQGGLQVAFKVARGPAGDEALQLAADGVLDGLSIGVDFDMAVDAHVDPNDDSIMNVTRADLREVSLTAMPLYDDARVSKVAASRNEGNKMDPCSTCGQVHAEGVSCSPPTPPANGQQQGAGMVLSADQLSSLLARPGALQSLFSATPAPAAATAAAPPGGLTLSQEQLDAIIRDGRLGTLLGVPQLTPAQAPEPRPTVDPTHNRGPAAAVRASVQEPLPYRFDREGNLTKGVTYDFSTDLVASSKGDSEAEARTQKFLAAMAGAFTRASGPTRLALDVDMADAATLNPSRQRPDMYVDQKDFAYPIWDAISKGTLSDQTPFVLPKFSSSSGLVAAHVEGVEPTPGTFVATAQTITPSAVSGKVEITREAWDQGGNPQLSGIIWRQMTKAWFEALEAAAVTMLDGLSPTGITLTTAATDDALVGELEAAIAALQFIRGGMRMRDLFLQIDLYKALTAAVDADGRKLLPLLGPVNASGQVSELFADLNISGLRGRPAWALAASGTVAASSYLFDRDDVHGWASAPQRLEFQYRVAYVDVAIWGYKALANTDLTGVREIIYDPA